MSPQAKAVKAATTTLYNPWVAASISENLVQFIRSRTTMRESMTGRATGVSPTRQVLNIIFNSSYGEMPRCWEIWVVPEPMMVVDTFLSP